MLKEMQDLERRYHVEQIADYEQRAAQATDEADKKFWQDLADKFCAIQLKWEKTISRG